MGEETSAGGAGELPPPSPAETPAYASRRRSRRAIALPAVLGTIAFVLLFGWDGLKPIVSAPLIVGAFVGLIAEELGAAGISGAYAGLAGAGVSAIVYRISLFAAYLRRINPASKVDIGPYLLKGFVTPLVSASPVNHGLAQIALTLVIATALAAVAAVGAAWAAGRVASAGGKRLLGLALIVSLGACLAWTLFAHSSSFVKAISTDPAPKSYAFDPIINLKTYYLIRGGMNYYDAIITAAAGDQRINDIRNNKWGRDWTIVSPTRVRQPAVFYFWALVGHWSATGILWASVLLAVGVWIVWYWALFPILGQRGLMVALTLYPAFVVHMAWWNLLHPDWWAALMLLYSAAFLIAGRLSASAAFGFLAAISREVFVFYLLALLVVALVLWLRRRQPLRSVIPFGVALVAFAAAFAVHYLLEAPYVVLKSGSTTLSTILDVSARPISQRFLGPTSYLMFPYGDSVVPAFILVAAGAAGLYLVLRRAQFARLALPGYLAFFLAFMVIVGASSTYWGQDVTLLGLAGLGALLGGLGTLRNPAETPASAS
jgi:hypothetical protein